MKQNQYTHALLKKVANVGLKHDDGSVSYENVQNVTDVEWKESHVIIRYRSNESWLGCFIAYKNERVIELEFRSYYE
jgi:hypothetical protein